MFTTGLARTAKANLDEKTIVLSIDSHFYFNLVSYLLMENGGDGPLKVWELVEGGLQLCQHWGV